jgi:HJR/Mrr/RecB family endonuclease
LGYETHWCGKSGDQGADVLALHPTSATLIQVKHTQSNNYQGTSAIKEIRGAKSHYESKLNRSLKLMAATNFKFHERAVQLAREGEPVELLEFARIRDLLIKTNVTAKDIALKKAKGKFKL